MKKIIATVLAMVMALALCTTAFAAMPEGATKVNPDQGKTLKETYYKLGDEYYTDEECTKLVTAEVKAVLENGGYEAITLKQYKAAAAATCTADGWAVNVYIDKDNNLYVKADDVKAYEDKYEETLLATKTAVYVGTKMENVVKYYAAGTAADTTSEIKLAKGHVLVKTDDTYGTSKATVYKCILCNGTYALESTITTDADKAAVKTAGRINYQPTNNTQAMFDKGYLNATEASAGVYVELKAGTTTGTTNTTKPSPKTFDAGIAMYVGMALTSVAGSAVVIGKKKEF